MSIEHLKNVICKRQIYSEKSSALKITLLSNISSIECRSFMGQCKVSFAIMRYFHVKLRCIYWIPFFLVFFVESSIENHQFYIKNHRISNKISISSWSKKIALASSIKASSLDWPFFIAFDARIFCVCSCFIYLFFVIFFLYIFFMRKMKWQ